MGRDSTFFDEQQRRSPWDPNNSGQFTPNLVFVGMGFGPEMMDIFETIREECKKLGLDAKRVDESAGSGFVHIEIKDAIESAEFCIFDLSNDRPNVYYELGYAHGVGNESHDILLIAKQGTALHYDVAPLRVNFYADTSALRDILRQKLSGMIAKTRR